MVGHRTGIDLMRFDLRSRVTKRRGHIVFANITPTRAQADALALIYLKVVRGWEEGTQRIVDSYERTLAELITDSPADTAAVIDSIDDAMRRLVLMLTPDLRNWAFRVEEVQRGKWIRNVLSAVSIDLTTILIASDVASTVQAAIEWNVSLIKDVSDEIRRKVTNSVFTGFRERKAARDIAAEIRNTTGLARDRSLRIARDQTVKLGSKLNESRQRQAGLDHFKWRHSGKVHPRKHHLERDGKVFKWTDPEVKEDLPGDAPYCGCNAQGVLVLDD